jgi:hypothetical protein
VNPAGSPGRGVHLCYQHLCLGGPSVLKYGFRENVCGGKRRSFSVKLQKLT